ncbi:hypothetical protein LguiA_025915 [Lonicera macranthoides]
MMKLKLGIKTSREDEEWASLLVERVKEVNMRERNKRGIAPVILKRGNDLTEEHSDIVSEGEAEEIVVHKEPSMYDNLLKTLGSGSEFLASVYKRRFRKKKELSIFMMRSQRRFGYGATTFNVIDAGLVFLLSTRVD